MNSYVNECSDKFEHIKDIIKIMSKFVKDGKVEKRKFGEVMTPISLVKEMLDTLPKEVWSNPNLKWLDPANGAGTFPYVVIYKLMNGLSEWEPDVELRYKHIVENMIYTCELQSRNVFLWLCGVDPKDEYTTNSYWGSFLDEGFDYHMKNVWSVENFDIIIGNPPYQEEIITKKGSAKALYNIFTEKSISITNLVSFITPSRWFAGGKGLESFRLMMIKSNKIKSIKHFDDASKIFENVDITGGVSYFIFDNNYNGLCTYNQIEIDLSKYDIIVNPIYYSIIDKVSKYDGLNKICKGQSYSGITTNDIRLSDTESDNHIKCYVSKVNGYEKWINRNQIRNIDLNKWKVITARANGSYPRFGNKFIGKPNEICNQSYICFEVNSKLECENLLKYINTKFANFLLSIRKISQDLKPDTCKWIPYINLNKEMNDDDLAILFNLTSDEKNIIGI
jgi:site-specific DNA-methyltransferase (adenine-specific)